MSWGTGKSWSRRLRICREPWNDTNVAYQSQLSILSAFFEGWNYYRYGSRASSRKSFGGKWFRRLTKGHFGDRMQAFSPILAQLGPCLEPVTCRSTWEPLAGGI